MKTAILKKFTRVALPLFVLLCLVPGVAGAATQAASLLEPAQLNKWIDNSYRTEKGERVVIIDVVPDKESLESWFAGDMAKLRVQIAKKYGGDSPSYRLLDLQDQAGLLGHIPGAIFNVSHGNLETMARSDGPIAADHEIGSGAGIDELLKGHGITADDVIVITSSQQTPWMACPPRLWWTLYYWGFTTEKIKLLNGGNKAYVLAGYKLERGLAQPQVQSSKFTVAKLPTRHFDARVGLQEMIDLVDSGKTVNGAVVLLDVRQPPAAYYLKDALKVDGSPGADGIPDIYQIKGFSYNQKDKSFTRASDKQRFNLSQMLFSKETNDGNSARVIFNPAANRPITIPNEFMAIHSSGGAPLAIPIGGRSGDFEGIIKGAHLIKSASYDLTVPVIAGKDNRFKSREALRTVFAKAGIDGEKPIIIYCNAGSLGSFYFYVLHEVCGFENVRMYDGSWQEWANLTSFEPADATFVRHDVETVYPSWPAPAPSILLFSSENHYLEWNGTQFVNDATALSATALQVKAGGTLRGTRRWDTLHRSEHIVFRPSAKVNDAQHFQTFNSDTDWPSVDTIPDYDGDGNEILTEDRSYGK